MVLESLNTVSKDSERLPKNCRETLKYNQLIGLVTRVGLFSSPLGYGLRGFVMRHLQGDVIEILA